MCSSTLQFLHISEFGKISTKFPDKAREIVTCSLNALAPGQYVFVESTAEGREGYFYQMCKEAQALQDSGKTISSRLQVLFFALACPYGVTIPKHYSDYFNALEGALKSSLDEEQRAWYVKRASTQGEGMKRGFPSTLDEAFESSNEGGFYDNARHRGK